jgi:tetratricopeptide (TPR) repeat protein
MVKISLTDYKKNEYNWCSDETGAKVRKEYIRAKIRGEEHIIIHKDDFDHIITEVSKIQAWNKLINKTAELNNKGIKLEKEGKIDEAIIVYEENIKSLHPATHSYERLMILYRKRKDVENEIRVIKIAIDVFSKANERRGNEGYNVSGYKKRLEKLSKLVPNRHTENMDIDSFLVEMANYRLDELKKLNQTLETAKEPTILENCLSNMIEHVEWFMEEENREHALFSMAGGASNMLGKIKNRYNERLHSIAKEPFDSYKAIMSAPASIYDIDLETEKIITQIQTFRGFIEKTAENYQEYADAFKKFSDDIELVN